MKRYVAFAAAALAATTMAAQTLNIQTGGITYAVPAAQAGDMVFSSGQTITVLEKQFALSDITGITVDNTEVADNTVAVTYEGTSAKVVVAGNAMKYLTVRANGAHVSVVQDASLPSEITYTLSGSTTNGSFYMDGKLKATVVLNGVTINNPDSAAINIRNGKRIAVVLTDGTTSTLTDGEGGSQKACFAVKGHTEFDGTGVLNITGRTNHAFWGKEYVQLKKGAGTINILGAVADGFNVNQYYQQNGGTVTINSVGDDGLQVSYKTDDNDQKISLDEDEDNTGEVLIKGGTLTVNVSAAAAKAIKAEGNITINESKATATINATTTGGGKWDEDDQETKACAGLKADGNIQIDAGTITLKSTGAGGKGMKCSGTLTISGGTVTAATTGSQYTYGSSSGSQGGQGGFGGGGFGPGGGGGGFGPGGGGPGGGGNNTSSNNKSSPKGIKAKGDITINDGKITVTTTGTNGEGIESKACVYIKGGTVNVEAYDDCINAAADRTGHLYVQGGTVTVKSANNDGLDANGNLYIEGGTIYAFGSGAPECGIDANEEVGCTVFITGGYLFAIGSNNSHPTTSASTQCYLTTSGSVTKGNTVTVKNSDSETLATFTMPYTYSNGSILVSTPEVTAPGKYNLVLGSTTKSGLTATRYSSSR